MLITSLVRWIIPCCCDFEAPDPNDREYGGGGPSGSIIDNNKLGRGLIFVGVTSGRYNIQYSVIAM